MCRGKPLDPMASKLAELRRAAFPVINKLIDHEEVFRRPYHEAE